MYCFASGEQPGFLESKGGFFELGHKFVTVVRDEIICKHYSALLSKTTISNTNKFKAQEYNFMTEKFQGLDHFYQEK